MSLSPVIDSTLINKQLCLKLGSIYYAYFNASNDAN